MENEKNIFELGKKKRMIVLMEKIQSGKITKSELKELEVYENQKKPVLPNIMQTQEEVAKALKVSSRTVRYWGSDGMPTNPDGTYDIIKIQAWRTAKNKKGNPEENKRLS